PRWLPVVLLNAAALWTSIHTGVVAGLVTAAVLWPVLKRETRTRQLTVVVAAVAIGAGYWLQVQDASGLALLRPSLTSAGRELVIGLCPLPLPQREFWNTSILDNSPTLFFSMGLLMVAVIAVGLRARRGACFAWLGGVTVTVLLGQVAQAGQGTRHFG